MRLFVIFGCFVTLSLAKPQYNYGSGISGSFGGSDAGTGNLGSFGGLQTLTKVQGSYRQGATAGLNNAGTSFASGSSTGINSIFGSASSLGSYSLGDNYSVQNQHQQQQHSANFKAPIVHKQFFTIAAPEDNENLERTKHFVIGRPQKNYRVVFIKAPSSSNANVKLSAEYAPQEEKTVIYVLSKKDNTLEVSDIATPAPTVPSKPEVVFIKYKTDEEAQHAQKQIQAEYDRLEGSSEHADGGVAPQHSVVGLLDGGSGISSNNFPNSVESTNSFVSGNSGTSNLFAGDINAGLVGSSSHTGAKSSAYLPPTSKK